MCGSPEWLGHVRPASSVERAAALDNPLPGEVVVPRIQKQKSVVMSNRSVPLPPVSPPPLPAAWATRWSARASATVSPPPLFYNS
jgi:hypothetical protein